jgi:hypothetical protein
MAWNTQSQFGSRLAIGLALLLSLRNGLNQFESFTRVPVEDVSRGLPILMVCILMLHAFLHYYEVRQRA